MPKWRFIQKRLTQIMSTATFVLQSDQAYPIGAGGLEEFKKHLVDKEAYFGYIRMVVGNDELVRPLPFPRMI